MDERVTVESLKRSYDAVKPQPQGDKPRKVIVCNPDEYDAIQRCVVHDLGHRDVLVKPNRLIDCGQAYVIDAAALDRYLDPFSAGPRRLED